MYGPGAQSARWLQRRGASALQAGRLGNMLLRARAFVAVVIVAALAGSIAWNVWGPGIYVAGAEVLVAAKIPAGSQSGQYDVEFSRASASDFIVDDLGRIVEGNAFAGLVAQRYQERHGELIEVDELAEALTSDRSHRGLKLVLRWRDSSQAARLIDLAATALTDEAELFYPTIHEVADLAIIDLAASAKRPGLLAAAFDIALKLAVAVIAVAALVIWWDVARGRLYSEDVEELLGVKLLARLD